MARQLGSPSAFIELTLDSSVTTYGEVTREQRGGPRLDFVGAAAQLGVTEEALMAALGERQGPPDFAAAAATLGVTEAELMTALGIGGRPPGEEPPTNSP